MSALRTVLIVLSTMLALISSIIYARSIFRGEARPHRTTRFVLLIITVLSTASLIAQHNTVAVWLAGVSAIQAIFIFYLSIKHGMGGWSWSDILCLLVALCGIIIWQTSQNPVLGLYCAILADFTGMIPALIKTYRWPETENVWFFGLDTIAGTCTVLAVSAFTLAQTAYPAYVTLINLVMVLLILRPRLSRSVAIINPWLSGT